MTRKEEAEEKRQIKLDNERKRVAGMRTFEQEAARKTLGGPNGKDGLILVCGIDEAGRGPLAGPVAAGACILPLDHDILWLNDSKKLSPKKREELFGVITREAIAWKVCMVGPERIDEINILQADYEAMRAAVLGLRTAASLPAAPDVLVNDAVVIPGIDIPQCGIVKGDAKCLSVAAASILAKVTRDHFMEEMDRQYPEYGFARNKGYGTREHIEALKRYGPCPIHRRTFIGHFVNP